MQSTYLIICYVEDSGIENHEVKAPNLQKALMKLSNRLTVPYEVKAYTDISLDKAIQKAERLMEKLR
jgi:hypothetical protein